MDGVTMTRKYFGTDGIRGRANSYPMTADVALKLGMAAALRLTDAGHLRTVISRAWSRGVGDWRRDRARREPPGRLRG